MATFAKLFGSIVKSEYFGIYCQNYLATFTYISLTLFAKKSRNTCIVGREVLPAYSAAKRPYSLAKEAANGGLVYETAWQLGAFGVNCKKGDVSLIVGGVCHESA